MKIIGFTGPAGSGKSTAAGLLAARLADAGRSALITGFAAALKRLCRQAGWDGRKDGAGRKLLQAVGQAAREIDPEHWISALAESLPAPGPGAPDVVIVQDVRFENEAAWIRARGGEIWRLVGWGGLAGEAGAHASEAGIEPTEHDTIVPNRGNLEQLKLAVYFMADFLEREK